METKELKKYAPQARRDFIAAVTDRAALFGLTEKETAPVTQEGDVAIIQGQAFDKDVAVKRERLVARIKREGFVQVMEAMAYTWFNRLVAIRYMELHGFLDHGFRVLSHPEGKLTPEILEHAAEVDLVGLNRDKVVELKLDGGKDEELYRLLLRAQCNALHEAMPFLFESVAHETELLLPNRLLHTDSLVRKMVEEVPEEAWREGVEIIGWLYQFYISEKKDEVIGKVVKPEDIPAATQLFTPNWIVRYMVQNTIGAKWLATYPDSPLREQMEFYIEPADQTEELKAHLAAITPKSLNPEEITCIDPACGSGHILVEAYDLLKAIYLERGYRPRDIPRLILEKNLFGLDIDERAAQLAAFVLIMRGRVDDPQMFRQEIGLNVVVLRPETAFDPDLLSRDVNLQDYGLDINDLSAIRRAFQDANVTGSLLHVSEELAAKIPVIKKMCKEIEGNLLLDQVIRPLAALAKQAEMLSNHYDIVAANPPYMQRKSMTPYLKKFIAPSTDLFAASVERFLELSKPGSYLGLMTPFTWLALKTFEKFRDLLKDGCTLQSLIEPEYHAFFESANVPICTFAIRRVGTKNYQTKFIKLSKFYGADIQPIKALEAIRDNNCEWLYKISVDRFEKIPGRPIAYFAERSLIDKFEIWSLLGEIAEPKQGLSTANNALFTRHWTEVDFSKVVIGAENHERAQETGGKWFPLNRGGAYRKWFGNVGMVINWSRNGREVKAWPGSAVRNESYYFQPAVTWTDISSSTLGARVLDPGYLFANTGSCVFGGPRLLIAGFLVSKVATAYLKMVNPTFHCEVGDIARFPFDTSRLQAYAGEIARIVDKATCIAREDWNEHEMAWDFQRIFLLRHPGESLHVCWSQYCEMASERSAQLSKLETENNRLFIEAYGADGDLDPTVEVEDVTLRAPDREVDCRSLISYAIGCMMGRYSLDEPGLIYAHSGNEGFDSERYKKFPADNDGVIPLTDINWFGDDAAHRLDEFLSVAWDASHLEENLTFLADNLSPKRGESSRDTIRRYLSTRFFKDHLRTYKKRPIYWLFSSGKQRAFQALVYLHRYNEGTLGRMRTEYVVPLQGKIGTRIPQLEADILSATSTSHRKRLEKERDMLVKQRVELQEFDEKLRHYADQRIVLDLDDGVKVNYGKFGDLLAEVKAVTGKKPS